MQDGVDSATDKVNDLGNQFEETGDKTSIIETGLKAITDKLGEMNLPPALETGLSNLSSMLGGLDPKVMAVVGGVGLIGSIGVKSATDAEGAMKSFQAQTDVTNDELQLYNDIMIDIYNGNYGESFEDVAGAMALVKQQIDGINDSDLQLITGGALTLRDTFDMDLNETIRGTDQLMTVFGVDAQTAMDLMATGAQNGLNYTDELGDNISEYSGTFAQAGYSAEEYFQLLQNGSDNGAYNLDKVNDAINEVTTRLEDGTIEENMSMFSRSTQDVFQAWKSGQATQKDVIDSIVSDISNCTNEQEKLTMASTAFGTMGEDANTKFVESLTPVGDTYSNVNGAMQNVQATASGSLSASLEELSRNFNTLLIPIVQLLIPVLNLLVQVLTVIVQTIANVISWIVQFCTNWEFAVQVVTNVWNMFTSVFGQAVNAVVSGFTEEWNNLVTWWSGVIQSVVDFVVGLWNGFTQTFSQAVNAVVTGFQTEWQNLCDFWGNVISTAIAVFQGLWDGLVTWFTNLINGIVTFFTNAWNNLYSFFSTILSNISGIFRSVWEGMVNNAVTILNGFIGNVKSIVNGIKQTIQGIIDFVTGVFTGNWQKAWNGVKNIFSGIWNSLSGVVSNVWNNILGLFSNGGKIFSGVVNGISNVFRTIVNNLISGINRVIATPFNTINGILNGIRNISVLGAKPFAGLWSANPLPVPRIPMLERGGVLKKGQVGLLEGNGAEAVVPLDRNKAWIRAVAKDMLNIMPQVQNKTNNQTVNFYQPVETADQVARALRLQQRYGLAG